MNAYRDTDFLYLSARMRARLGLAEALASAKVASAANYREACRLLGEGDVNELLDRRMKAAFDLTREFSPNPIFISIFAYPYDCQNIKIVLKYELMEIREAPPLFSCGTVSEEAVIEAVKSRDYTAFPPHLAQEAPHARELVVQSGDIQALDFALDRAALLDMASAAMDFGCAFIVELVSLLIDAYHIQSFVRIREIGMNKAVFERLYVEGGSLSLSFFQEYYEQDIPQFCRALLQTNAASAVRLLEAEDPKLHCSGAALQLALEQEFYEKASEAKHITFGAEPVAAFLLGEEREVKTIRRILAQKRAEEAAANAAQRRGESADGRV